MAISNTVARMFENNNATVDGIRAFASEKVAETKAHLNATGEQVIAAARGGGRVVLGGGRVLLGGARRASPGLNATHI